MLNDTQSSGNISFNAVEIMLLFELVKDLRDDGIQMLDEMSAADPERNELISAQANLNSLYRKLKKAVDSIP